MKISPPKRAHQFLRWFCREDYLEEIEGDLMEVFEKQYENSPRKANRQFICSVIRYFRPGFIKSFKNSFQPDSFAMYRNYFKIAWRNLLRQKMYSSIKIGGFALGIAACLLIALFVKQELSFDQHYRNGDRIFRLLRESGRGAGLHFPSLLAEVIRKEYPEIEKAGHILQNFGAGSNEVRRTDATESTHEEGLIFADQEMLQILEVPFIKGDAENALMQPNTMVITQNKAEKYFPNGDAIGKQLIMNNDSTRIYTVTGVVKDCPASSHLQYDFVMTLYQKEFWPGERDNWGLGNYIVYLRVKPGTEITKTEKKLSRLLDKYFLPGVEGQNAKDWVKSLHFKLQPIDDVYINRAGLVGDGVPHGDLRFIWLFASIAVFILLIATINFINLATARSANRAKEVGLRKVVGSRRINLIKQFLTESLAYSFFSFVLGFALAWLALPAFNQLVAKSLVFPWSSWWLMPSLVVGTFVVGLLAGIYPSFYLSSFKPVQVFKGAVSLGSRGSGTRGSLVVFQFAISVILIIGTIVIDKQMKYVLNTKLGYDKDQVLLLESTNTLGDKTSVFKNKLLRLHDVKYVSVSGFLPIEGTRRNNSGMWKAGKDEEDRVQQSQHWNVDVDYLKTFGIRLLNGRDFSEKIASDSQAVIINQSMADALQLTDPIGQHVKTFAGEWTVIGVVEDFHYQSMKEKIMPMGIYLGKSQQTISVKLNTGNMQEAIASISKVWEKFSPNQTIRFSFLDQSYAKMYDDIKRMGWIFAAFATLAIIVACLGLFALSAFMVEQRRKEISIRLVLGASLNSIFQLLTKNFLRLVMISLVIAAPVAWYAMHMWLQDYAYKTEINWQIFAIAGLMAVMIALVTVSYQAIRAALMKPAESLRTD